MRKLILACLVSLAAAQGVILTSQALAQQQGGGQQGKQKSRPAPPPPPRCPDLGVGTTAYLTEAPGGPLAPNEVAISWQVRNDGNAPFVARDVSDTSVALEYTSPAGVTRIAIAPAITTLDEDGRVMLAYNHAVRGIVRGVIPAEAAGRRLRLRLVYSSERSRAGIPDCNEANNIAPLPHPPTAPNAAPAPAGR
jgi:hypothetical protein